MITNIRMKNFKSWADTGEIRLAPLTGFFGTNSSGKTSLLQMLLLLKQTTESPDRKLVLFTGGEKEGLVDLGTLPEIIHNEQHELELGLAWQLANPLRIPIGLRSQSSNEYFSIEEMRFLTKVHAANDGTYVDHFSYQTDSLTASLSRKSDDEYDIDVAINGSRPRRSQSRPVKYMSPIKSYGFSAEALRFYQNIDFLNDLVLEFEELFQRVFYLGPLREYPQRVYNWAGREPSDVGKKGELAVAALLARGKDRLYKKRGRGVHTLETRIAQWLKDMGMVESFRTVPIREGGTQYELRVRRSTDSKEVLITDMGFGVSQVLPILVLCYYVPEDSTIIVEQPEIHLHPSVQSALADVFIDAIKTRHLQIIVESHSEHFLRRLQRRIAENEIKSGQTALYFCDVENGASKIDTLHVDMFGNIRNWPRDFFGDITGDLLEMAQSGIKRQLNNESR